MQRLFLLMVLASMPLWAQEGTKVFMVLDPTSFAKAMKAGLQAGDGVVLDVRKPEEFAAGHIEGAKNIDYYGKTFKESLAELPRDKTYLIYCRSGGRSGRTSAMMNELGFQRVFDLEGGMIAWQKGKHPIAK